MYDLKLFFIVASFVSVELNLSHSILTAFTSVSEQKRNTVNARPIFLGHITVMTIRINLTVKEYVCIFI